MAKLKIWVAELKLVAKLIGWAAKFVGRLLLWQLLYLCIGSTPDNTTRVAKSRFSPAKKIQNYAPFCDHTLLAPVFLHNLAINKAVKGP